MGGKIPEHIIQDIKDRVSIREVVEDYVRLQKDGANHKGLCPFHQEKTPSFKVHEGKGIFKCFGCGESGNVINFLMKLESMSFREAAEKLAARAGIEIPKTAPSPEETKKELERDQLYGANLAAAKFYRAMLLESPEGAIARDYLQQRDMSPETIKRFGLGYSPDDWTATFDALAGQGIAPADIHGSGLAIPRDNGTFYDRFRGRLMFPIIDVQGRVRGFGARLLKDEAGQPKYVNSPESPIFKKGSGFYGLNTAKDAIRKSGRAVVVEGYFDQIALDQAGIAYGLAALGTAFTTDHAYVLKRYGAQVFMVFDADEAGERASLRALEVFLEGGLSPRVVAIPDGKDPDDFMRKHSKEEFEALLEKAPPLLERYLELTLARAGNTPGEKAKAVAEAARMVGRVKDPIERSLFVDMLSQTSGVPVRELASRLRRPEPRRDGEGEVAGEVEVEDLARAELDLLRLCIHHPELLGRVRESGVVSSLSHRGLAGFLEQMMEQTRVRESVDLMELAKKISDGGLSDRITRVILEDDSFKGTFEKALEDLTRQIFINHLDDKIRSKKQQRHEALKNGENALEQTLLQELQKLSVEKQRIASGAGGTGAGYMFESGLKERS